jgi:hypothetical protein
MLDSNGVEPRRKRGLWTIGSIDALIKNTHYSGFYKYKDSKVEHEIEIQCPSIVDLTTWNAVQYKRSSPVVRNSQKNATVKHFYLLRDFMYCGHCGRAIAGRITQSRAEMSYYCPNKEREWAKKRESATPWQRGMGCGFGRAMNIKQTDALIWETIKQLHRNSSILKENAKHRILKEGGVVLKNDAETKATQAKLRKFQKEHQRLSESLGTWEANRLIKDLNDVAFAATTDRFKQEIARVETELASLRLELAGAAADLDVVVAGARGGSMDENLQGQETVSPTGDDGADDRIEMIINEPNLDVLGQQCRRSTTTAADHAVRAKQNGIRGLGINSLQVGFVFVAVDQLLERVRPLFVCAVDLEIVAELVVTTLDGLDHCTLQLFRHQLCGFDLDRLQVSEVFGAIRNVCGVSHGLGVEGTDTKR